MLIYQQTLGIDHTACDREIRERYLALVRQYPPERAPEKFQQITRAYEALRNRRNRVRSCLAGLRDYQFWTDALDALTESIPEEKQVPGLTRIREADGR